MKREGDAAAETGVSQLRAQAVKQAEALLQQLAADHADLNSWAQRSVPAWMSAKQVAEIAPGANAVAKVIQAAQHVRERLQGG